MISWEACSHINCYVDGSTCLMRVENNRTGPMRRVNKIWGCVMGAEGGMIKVTPSYFPIVSQPPFP